MIAEAQREYAEEYWRNVVLDLQPGSLVQWHLGDTNESCETCIEMSGLGPVDVMEFVARGVYPQSHELACGGYNCRCFLTVVDAPILQADEVLSDLTRYGNIGDEGLISLYAAVHQQILEASADWSGLTPVSAGKSWFDAPASSAGSFTGARYGGSIQDALEMRAKPPNQYGGNVIDDFNSRITFDAPAVRRAWDTDLTVGELRWQEEPEHIPSTITAPASSRGSFKGSRYGG